MCNFKNVDVSRLQRWSGELNRKNHEALTTSNSRDEQHQHEHPCMPVGHLNHGHYSVYQKFRNKNSTYWFEYIDTIIMTDVMK